MNDKYLSIITNFGCHYKCPYCIVKNNNLHVPVTTLDGLDTLALKFGAQRCNIISISGGGDPLHEYEKHVDWYRKLFKISKKIAKDRGQYAGRIPIEMHTSYLTDQTTFPFYDCYRVVYHVHSYEDLQKIHRTGDEIVRAVFVVTEDYTIEDIMRIAMFVHDSNEIDELSFRQLVDENYQEHYYLHDYLKLGHRKFWHYIEQNDYNIYYAENQVFYRYEDLKEGLVSENEQK